MTAGFHHFVIEQGATFSRILTLKDSTGTVVNLNSYSSAEMDLRKNPESSSVVITLTTSNSRISLGGAAGTVTLTISASATANLTAEDGVYDLELTDSGGNVFRILEGTFSVRRNISR